MSLESNHRIDNTVILGSIQKKSEEEEQEDTIPIGWSTEQKMTSYERVQQQQQQHLQATTTIPTQTIQHGGNPITTVRKRYGTYGQCTTTKDSTMMGTTNVNLEDLWPTAVPQSTCTTTTTEKPLVWDEEEDDEEEEDSVNATNNYLSEEDITSPKDTSIHEEESILESVAENSESLANDNNKENNTSPTSSPSKISEETQSPMRDTTNSNDVLAQPLDMNENSNQPAGGVLETIATSNDTSLNIKSIATEKLSDIPYREDKKNQPTKEELLHATDILFRQVVDKSTVTVKDICVSIEVDLDCILDRTSKAMVKVRLTELVKGGTTTESEDNDVEDSDVGDTESSESEVDDDDDVVSEDEDNDEDYHTTQNSKCLSTVSKKNKKKSPKRQAMRNKMKKPRFAKESAKLAQRVHTEQMRKRRLEELRVRNEELMMHQSVKDQERAELIAQKLDTDTNEQRYKRLEKRLDLLEKLDHRRIACVQRQTELRTVETVTPTINPISTEFIKDKTNQDSTSTQAKVQDEGTGTIATNDESSDDDDDDEMELEIEGGPSSSSLLVMQNRPHSQAMSLLNLADADQLKPINKRSTGMVFSPVRSMGARAALRNKLKQKQRAMGNLWLARELGYTDEKEHLKDCLQEEKKRRGIILRKEEERVKLNERSLLRERMLEHKEEDDEGNVVFDNNDDDEYVENDDIAAEASSGEEDEEMAMVKVLLAEQNLPKRLDEENETTTQEIMERVVEDEQVPTRMNSANRLDIILEESCSENENDDTELPDHGKDGSSKADMQNIYKTNDILHSTDSDESNAFPDTDTNNHLPIESRATQSMDSESNNEASVETIVAGIDDSTEVTSDESKEMINEVEMAIPEKNKGPRNAAWKAMLQRDAQMAKKKKRSQLVEEEAEEEEEEEVAGLEDFGFAIKKKNRNDDDEEDEEADQGDFDEEDLKHVVDDVSEDEGDEEAGELARKNMEQKEEKERHKEMLRRMRDGYDGRRGGIAYGGAGARGMHRYDQLVAADNKEDARRLGLLNDDEIDSDAEKDGDNNDDDEEDEAALVDKMLKDRFLHRSSVQMEDFSDDDEEETDPESTENAGTLNPEDDEDREQERLAKRFSKRARMQRLIELHGHEEEFSQSRLIDEDATLKVELQRMKNGLARKRSVSSSNNILARVASNTVNKKQRTTQPTTLTTSLLSKGGSLAIALNSSRRCNKQRTSFVRNSSTGSSSETACSSLNKCIAFNHVVFHSNDSRSHQAKNILLSGNTKPSTASNMGLKKSCSSSVSFFSKTVLAGKKRKT